MTTQAVRSLAEDREGEECFLSVVTASELLHGVYRATDEAVRARRAAWVEAAIGQLVVLPIDIATARTHARLWADLVAKGEMISPHDLWIAASAVTHGMALLTLHAREMERVPGLAVEVPPIGEEREA